MKKSILGRVAIGALGSAVISESTRFTNVFRVGVSYYFGGPATGN